MTSTEQTNNFIFGLAILNKYKTDEFSISVVITSGIVVQGMDKISKEDLEDIRLFGWEAGNNDGNGWAQFFKLEYMDF